jgi:hypothetical protein
MMMDEEFVRLRQIAMSIETTNQDNTRMLHDRLEKFKEAEKRKAAQEYNERIGDIERNHRLLTDELRQQRLSSAFHQSVQDQPRVPNEPATRAIIATTTPYELPANLVAREGASIFNERHESTDTTTHAPFPNDGTGKPTCASTKDWIHGEPSEKLGAFVLMDSSPDVSLSNIGATFNPDIHLQFLTNKKIHCELKRKQEQYKNFRMRTFRSSGCTLTLGHPEVSYLQLLQSDPT